MSTVELLMHEMGLTREDLERRKRQVGLTDADLEVIRGLSATLRPKAAELTEVFFAHLAQFDEARALLGQPELLAQAKVLKRAHLEAMFDADYGLAYAQQRVELGRLYSRASLPTRVFLGAFQHLMGHLGEVAGTASAIAALRKLAFFDIALIVDVLSTERERVIRQQQVAIRELSTPVLKLRDRFLLVPVIGVVDGQRARLLTRSMLRAIHQSRARVVVIDVTGVQVIDPGVAHHLFQAVSAARLMGVKVVVSGLPADVSQSLSKLGVDVRTLEAAGGDLQAALENAEQYLAASAVVSH